ncbi:S8 family serine peptidase [Actinoplanes sp. NPDC049265]|uniref:S8 family peptidase n=1 Tax=Actinoplanes sp. NPDC049265 TaxID=3363902 RepID=UPI00371B1658
MAAGAGTGPADPARTTTLITGDAVTLTPGGRVSVAPGPGRAKVTMLTSTTADGHTSVIPEDALPALRQGRLDRRLFDVTGLLAAGYDDRRPDLPLIAGAGTPAIGVQTRALGSIKASAVRAPKRALGATWKSLGPGGGKVWLDAVGHFTAAEGVQQIGAPTAWEQGLTGTGVTVGVIDSGVDGSHPDLSGVLAAQRDFSPLADGQPPTDENVKDTDGHGTHVASILAGSGAAQAGRYRGVAPGVRLVSAKVGDWEIAESAVIAAMEWTAATQHADVVNMSLGFPDSAGTDPMEAALADLTRRYGTLFVVAAGNDGNNGNDPDNGNDYDIGSPAGTPEALTVGAVDHDDKPAAFSSRGPGLGDLVKPDVTAPGVDVTSAVGHDSFEYRGNEYSTGYGTSFAAPHVAGAAAILAQAHPDWTPAMLKAGLMGGARPAAGVSVYAQGAGRVDVPRALAGPVLTEPASVSLTEAGTRTITYRNTGTSAVTLDLSVRADRGPAGTFTVSPSRLTVKAGAAATATLTVTTPDGAPSGAYSARIEAKAGSRQVGTPVGLIRAAEKHDLTITQLDATGTPSEDYYTKVIGLDVPYLFDSTGAYPWPSTYTLSVPRGRYAILTRMGSTVDGQYTGAVLVNPGLTVDRDLSVTLDGRIAQPVEMSVPRAGAVREQGALDIGIRTAKGWYSESMYLGGAVATRTAALGAKPDAAGFVTRLRGAFDDGGERTSAYAYQVGWVMPGEFPTGFSGTVAESELAVERVSARPQLPVESAYAEFQANLTTPGYPLTTISTGTKLPAEVRYSAGTWASQVAEYSDQGYVWTVGRPVRYRAGGTYTSRWNDPVIAPCLPTGSEVSWRDDLLSVRVPMACDAAGHAGTTDPAAGSTTLFRDGAAVATAGSAGHALFNLKPARGGTYRLNATADRGAGFATSVRTSVDWTFADPAVLPGLRTVRMTPAGQSLKLATAGDTDKVTLDVSFDDGATWRAVEVRRTGAGGYAAGVPGHGPVSLRVTATGGGSSVTETVIRAYELP